MNSFLFEQFLIADCGKYLQKDLFNNFKRNIIAREGVEDGFDCYHIKTICKSCKGTGEIKFRKEHWLGVDTKCKCNNGLAKEVIFYQKRIFINNILFHYGMNVKPNTGGPKNVFTKWPEPLKIAPRDSYKAMIILFLAYQDDESFEKLMQYNPVAQDIWAKEQQEILALIKSKAA